jgi:Skp family chaperone for outer membrane proteins
MKTMIKSLALAAAAFSVATPIAASAQSTPVGVADLQEAVRKTTAFTTATAQMKTTYGAQITSYETRAKALQTEMQPMVTAFQTAQRAPNPNQQALQTQYTALQQKQQAAQAELQRLSLPIARAQAYVEEQITGTDGGKLSTALKNAMTARGVQVVLQPQAAISYQPAADLTDAIAAELNKLSPTASITPPANWQPGGQQGAAQAANQQQKPQPQGR